MDYNGKVVAISGGGRGIGYAMAKAFHAQGAKIALGDLKGAEQAAKDFDGFGGVLDVTNPDSVSRFVADAEKALGPIDVFVSNAGVFLDTNKREAAGTSDEAWATSFEVNVMGAVRTAREIVPSMRERGGGVFVIVASAAGLLSQVGGPAYTSTKHAAVAFAETLAIMHGDEGVQVVCVCPQAVNTPMLTDNASDDVNVAAADGVVEPEDVAKATLAAIEDKRFLALSHPEVVQYEQFRAASREKWISAMRKFKP